MRIYYGMELEENRAMFATVTGQMADGTFVYTEIEMREDGSAVKINGEYKLLLDNQYTRHLKYGTQMFIRL